MGAFWKPDRIRFARGKIRNGAGLERNEVDFVIVHNPMWGIVRRYRLP